MYFTLKFSTDMLYVLWNSTLYDMKRNTRKKGPDAICGQGRSRSMCAFLQSDLSILCLSTYTVVSIDSVSGQRSPEQPAQMRRLIRTCVVRKLNKGHFRALRIICRNGGKKSCCMNSVLDVLCHNVRKHIFRPVRPAKIQISLRIRAMWSESSLGAFWIAKSTIFLYAGNEDSD